MVSVHPLQDPSFKAGTGVNTTTAIYKAVYLSGDNEVAICNTTTNFAKFVGILQEYANTTGAAVPVRVAGCTKAILKGASITAGDFVAVAAGTSTALGHVAPRSIKAGADLTSGAAYLIGKCVLGSQGGTGTVCEVLLQPMITNAITTTVVA